MCTRNRHSSPRVRVRVRARARVRVRVRASVRVRVRVRVRVGLGLGIGIGLELTPRLEELARQVVLRRVAECDAAVGPEKDALAHLLA